MGMSRVLIANRGEVAVRVARAAAELGLDTVAVRTADDGDARHGRVAGAVHELPGTGVAGYLDVGALLAAAAATGCDAVHPGYGFLSENAGFARRCLDAGLVFAGPRPEVLETFGDKHRARGLARRLGVPVLPGTDGPTTLEQAGEFLGTLPTGTGVMVKAVAGGGGRGMRTARDRDELAEAYERCRSEAATAFGSPEVYVERLLPGARHIEVQIAGDGRDVVSLGDRDCSLQRRRQKLVEIAPAPGLEPALRDAIAAAAVRMAAEAGYEGLGTFEFLVPDAPAADLPDGFAFIEANPRLQVEHTVTEEVTGIDLVAVQLELAAGRSLADLGLDGAASRTPHGFAVQARVNAETLTADGRVVPGAGTIGVFEPPTGPGVRVDSDGHTGHTLNPRFDSLLAKVIVHTSREDLASAAAKAARALAEFRIEGVPTNIGVLRRLLAMEDVARGRAHTRFVDEHLPELADPPRDRDEPAGHDGAATVTAPLTGVVVSVDVAEGDEVAAGTQGFVLEAMKMEHVVPVGTSGIVRSVDVRVGDTVTEAAPLARVQEAEISVEAGGEASGHDLEAVRPDLAEVLERRALGQDAARPEAVARRHATGHRTARENVADLCDPDGFVEYGAFAIAAQRGRRPLQDLVERTPADGMVAGIGTVNGAAFGPEAARCVVMSYDYTVLAGTQGHHNHRKKDRLFEIAERDRLPVVLFGEGGGGRPGDTDVPGVSGLDVPAFHLFARLNGLVPLVGVVSGRSFAGNAALLGVCDVIIATEDTNLGMGGPAMIEGGGLGVVRPEEIGPMDVQVPNGVVDIAVPDEEAAVRVAKRYLSYFQGSVSEWECADQRLLRHLVPENRLRAYDVRAVVETLADTGSVLELRPAFGRGMITALVRVEGRPIGVIANDPRHLGGAIDAPAAGKAARFLQLCDAFGLPVLSLCDTPGFMVGPESERTATVRHFGRMFVHGANLDVPLGAIVLRKAYGLGAQAMMGGSTKVPRFTIGWPTGEMGPMGLEGAVKLGFRRELEAIEDPAERQARYEQLVAGSYERGKALNVASVFELDDVIDPADTRRWIRDALPSAPPRARRHRIDTW